MGDTLNGVKTEIKIEDRFGNELTLQGPLKTRV